MEQNEGDIPPCEMTGWLHASAAERLFGMLGYDVGKLRTEACSREFKGFEMEAGITAQLANTQTRNTSVNVAGILRGSSRPEECVVVTGHWDHFGIGEKENGDSIYNGAVDNGTTMAWAFEIGEAFASLGKEAGKVSDITLPHCRRTGSAGIIMFTANPPVPPENMIACFNNDMMLAIGRMKDIMVTGYGQSDLDDMLAAAAEKQDRYILPDPAPETGMYFRSDHFPLHASVCPHSLPGATATAGKTEENGLLQGKRNT